MMRWLEQFLTRRVDQHTRDDVPVRRWGRLRIACHQLTQAEDEAAACLRLHSRPKLVLIDEEMAAVITPRLRVTILAEEEAEGP